MAAAGGGGSGKEDHQVFERRHGELVEEAGELAATTGAGVTVVAVSPRSGEPRVTSFPGGGGGGPDPEKKLSQVLGRNQEKVVGISMPEVLLAYEEQLRALRLRLLQQIREKEAAAAEEEEEDQTVPEIRRLG